MGVIATADLAYKYGSAIFKKIYRPTRDRKNDTRSKKSLLRLMYGEKDRATTLTADVISLGHYDLCPNNILQKKA